MNALAADDFEAADLLALARLDDGAPGRRGPVMVTAWPPRTGHEGTTQTPVPRGSGHPHPRPAHRRRQHRLPRSLLAVAMSSMPLPSTPSTGSALSYRAAGGLHTRDADVLEESDAER